MVGNPDGRNGPFQDTAGPAAGGRLHKHWKAYALEGVLLTIVGIVALAAPFAATLASTLLFGWLLVIGGILGGATIIQTYGHPGFWSSMLLSILVTILGAVIIYNPVAGAVTLTWMMGIYFVLAAILQFQLSGKFAGKAGSGRAAMIFSGIVNLVLAAILILGLPGTAVWAIGMYIGVSLVFSGIGLLMAALDARKERPDMSVTGRETRA